MATQLKNAIERGFREDPKLRRAVQREVDSNVGFGPPYLSLPFSLVVLAVLLISGFGGFLTAASARSWWLCVLFGVLTTLGVFLLDQVRLMQRRDTALKVGLYLDAKSRKASA
ncbi:hypothetical protein AB0E59_06170 [Lentzea sp. NPDC034063]|uniref:hypothetical protein n=1 Tax=unclassified Lentzea TaxID=2643253 RepID=UPI0033E48B68